MARIRSIHPDVCVSSKMAEQSAELERTFFRLLTYCDDQGRAVDNAHLVKAALYPLHLEVTWEQVEEELGALAETGLIARYAVAGKRYLVVTSWDEYQHPQRPAKEKLPAPPPGCMDAARMKLRGAVQSHGGENGARGLEGRGDCADVSATVPPPNPRRLEEVKSTLRAGVRESA